MTAAIDIKTVSLLTGEDRRRIWEKIDNGDYVANRAKAV